MSFYEVNLAKDLQYGADPRCLLDLYLPSTPAPPPVVLYLHGGAFQHGDKQLDAERLRRFAGSGIAVASANYRLAPSTIYPGPVFDAKKAVAWLKRSADRLHINGSKVGVWGASAGGYLASMVGLTMADEQLSDPEDLELCHVDAVVTWFGLSDFTSGSNRTELELQMLPPAPERILLGAGNDSRSQLAAASPIAHVTETAPPFLLAHGDLDHIVSIRESSALHDELVRAGVSSTFLVLGGAGHDSDKFNSPAMLSMTSAFFMSWLST